MNFKDYLIKKIKIREVRPSFKQRVLDDVGLHLESVMRIHDGQSIYMFLLEVLGEGRRSELSDLVKCYKKRCNLNRVGHENIVTKKRRYGRRRKDIPGEVPEHSR